MAAPRSAQRRRTPTPPPAQARKGERFAGEVRDLNSAGEGVVAHSTGRVLFVVGVWPGESGQFEITEIRGRAGRARLLSLENASAHRSAPPCPHYGLGNTDCGGCPWQFMAYEQQLQAKQERLQRVLLKLGVAGSLCPIWAAPEPFGYRNRTQLKTDGKKLGFVARASNTIAPIEDCLILNEKNRETLSQLRKQLPNPQWRPAKGKPWSALHLDDHVDAEALLVNERRPFRQGNSAQNTRMKNWLAEQLQALDGPANAVELFAGSGNFTEVLAAAGMRKIVAVDNFGPAVQALEKKGYSNLITRVENLGRDGAAAALEKELADAELLLLDPPRDGLRGTAQFLSRMGRLRDVIYISCDLATFSRDLVAFMDAGFSLTLIQPLDLFPQTPHLETMAVLRR
ncbi:MAG: 23S rRNA (uracil1939-C5)-methyltransferase [Halieaceae bacterium]|jgi:23S rRNA (uracil1939-C5)-methyltransferase